MSSPAPHLIQVLGMHRSGTSAVARAVNLLGASLGAELMAPQAEDNPRGYWEHREVQRLQQRFLEALNRGWDDPRAFAEGTWDRAEARALEDRLVELLLAELARAPFFALKDPRTCVLGPLWARVRERVGYQPWAVAVLRHPRGVIDSLARRSDVPSILSLWLWCRHNLGWLELSRAMPRVLLVFEELLVEPARAIAQVQSLPLPWSPAGAAEAAASVEASAPRSSRVDRPHDVDPSWWDDSLAFYDGLLAGPRSGAELIDADLETRLRNRMAQLDPSLELLGPIIRSESRHRWAFVRSQKDLHQLEARRKAAEDGRRNSESKLQAIEGSGGYKALRRLQLLRRRLRGR